MAFAYSDYFRKHKRVVFAVLTLIALFTFVIGDAVSQRGGGADVGRRARGWFDLIGEPVAVVDGTRLDEGHLEDLANLRLLILNYIRGIYRLGEIRTFMEAGFSPQEAEILPNLIELDRYYQQMGRNLATDPQLSAPHKALWTKFNELKDTDRVKNLMESRSTLGAGWVQSLPGLEEMFDPIQLVELEFWKRRADELGVVMPAAAVRDDLRAIGRNRVEETDLQAMRVQLRRMQPIPMDDLLNAMSDEYRAMIARDLVLGGNQAGLMQSSAGSRIAKTTPLDLWRGFTALRTQLDVAMLPIPVMNPDFVGKVPDPTVEELKAYFEKYKSALPDEDSEAPGFKLPRQVRVQVMHGNLRATQPARKYYEGLVATLDQLNPLAAQMALLAEYNARKNEFLIVETSEDFAQEIEGKKRYFRLGSWSSLREEPQYISQLAAGIAGTAAMLPTAPLGASVVLKPGFRLIPENVDALLEAAQMVARATAATTAWTDLAAPQQDRRIWAQERTQPFDEVAGILTLDRTDKLCRDLLQADYAELQKKLEDYGKKLADARARHRRVSARSPVPFTPPYVDDDTKQSIEDFLKEFATRRGLVFADTLERRDEKSLLDEKGEEKPLNSYVLPMFQKVYPFLPEDQLKQIVAARLADPQMRLYAAQEVRQFNDPNWFEMSYVWKADQSEERVPTFEEAEPSVRTAWLLEKARQHAEAAAEQFAKDAKKTPDGIKVLMDQPNFKPHEIISRFRLALNQAAADSISYETAPIPVIDRPPADFVAQALNSLREEGDHWIVWNKPKSVCYLILLRERQEPNVQNPQAREEFDFKIMVPGFMRQPLVAGVPFSQFVQQEKLQAARVDWQRFIKAHTKFNEQIAEKLAGQLRGLARAS